MFGFFEKRIPPYPTAEPTLPPTGFVAFLWACTRGMRGWILLLTLTSAALSVYEAFLFGVMSHVVNWLSTTPAAGFWELQRGSLLGIAAILLCSIGLLALHTMVMHQVLAINFPMRMRWVFHRLMLGQSMSFYADEFAGRITTKIMQTALAVREVVFIVVDVLVGVGVYFISILLLAGSFDVRLLLPFGLWLLSYAAACWFFVPRLGKIGKAQADARSLMTGRVTDAYTNIATVKLFAHTRREAEYARNAMDDFKRTGYAQMRLVSLFELTNHAMITLLSSSSENGTLRLPTPPCQILRMFSHRWPPGTSVIGTPSASSTSALPLLLLTPRLPCLLTRAPQAAATNMLQVLMLKVCEPSPPVPTMSTRCLRSATTTLVSPLMMRRISASISS